MSDAAQRRALHTIDCRVRPREQLIDSLGVHDGERKVYPVVVDEVHDGGEQVVDAAHLFQPSLFGDDWESVSDLKLEMRTPAGRLGQSVTT